MTVDTSTLVDEASVARYRRDGFVALRNVFPTDLMAECAEAAAAAKGRIADHHGHATFTQLLNVWREDDVLRRLTLEPALAAAAERLAGVRLRVWHDQVLIKEPRNAAPTEFHQDQPYWPHAGSRQALTAWIALVDVPVERGCMSFIPGSQRLRDLEEQDLRAEGSLFALAPELAYDERVTVPLRAGDLTFHDARTAHTANANATDDPRVALAVIYVDDQTTYTGTPHPITDGLGLAVGAGFPDDAFPRPVKLRAPWKSYINARRINGRSATYMHLELSNSAVYNADDNRLVKN